MGAPTDTLAEAMIARRSHWMNQLVRHAHERPDDVAMTYAGTPTTWSRLRVRVDRLADALHRRNVRFGDRVAILMMNCTEYFELVLAANKLGAIAVPVNFRLTAPEVAWILRHAEATVLFADDALVALAEAASAQLPDAPLLIVLGEPASSTATTVADLLQERGEPHPPVDVPEETPALIMYTSGTTGRPKGAVLTHQNMQVEAMTTVRSFRLFSDHDIGLVAAPMFHIAAVGVLGANFVIGAVTVVFPTGAFDPSAVLDCLEQEQVTNCFLVPAQWQAVCADPSVTTRKLHLKAISWGAAPASDTLLRQMSEVFPQAINVAVFGQTEMSPVTCMLDGDDAVRKLGSVGKPVPAVQVRIVDELMQDVPDGEVGEIVYRGATTMLGYWRDPEATAEAFAGGWFHSGDLVRRDSEGFIYVVDRKKDMIISGGENIYCAEVENVLAAHPQIAEVAVIGRPDPKWGESPIAVIAPNGPVAPAYAELTEWLRDRLAGYKHPKDVVVVDALPRNASGKIVKGELRKAHGGAVATS